MAPRSHILQKHVDPYILDHGYDIRFPGFQNLMQYRIRDILLVSSLYDFYVIEEDGRLYELIRNEYKGLNLSHSPEITRVSSGAEALRLAKEAHRFDLILTTQHIEDMSASQLARTVYNSGLDIPVVLLAYDNRELKDLISYTDISVFSNVFIWTGDYRLLIAIIKTIEDKKNVQHDTDIIGVQCIILIEDNVHFYSSFLPMLYTEILEQSQQLISEGVNLTHKYLRMRARPKILACTNYEQAWEYFIKYKEHVLGIISDIAYERNGRKDPQAGIEFARNVKELQYDIPILLQSSNLENAEAAHEAGASFLHKYSPTLLYDLRIFAVDKFGFGDFIFRTEQGAEVGRARSLPELEEQIRTVPAESIRHHAERNHFSNWLKARTEFALAHKLRPHKVSHFESVEHLRNHLAASLREYRKIRQRGIITDFHKDTFDPVSGFARIGGGSLGGKARGLTFINSLVSNFKIYDNFKGIKIRVPAGVVLGTDAFDSFLDSNNLRGYALKAGDDKEMTERFLSAVGFPDDIRAQLADFLDIVHEPLAIRSSSLLEDSQYHPFAGVYETYMVPNNHQDDNIRLEELIQTIKQVYASTFYQATKDYIKVTSYRLEEEKMAVIIHKLVGSKYKDRFYPTFSGVAKSYNFYPVPPQTSEDGIVSAALGLGRWVVEGGSTVKFSPEYPKHVLQFYSPREAVKNGQHKFYALNLKEKQDKHRISDRVKLYSISKSKKDGSINYTGSTYSPENNTLHDGLSREGVPIISFAPILKHNLFPLTDIIKLLLELGKWGMGSPVEIEFAVNLNVPKGKSKEFGILQMRPLVLKKELAELTIKDRPKQELLCSSSNTLGHGIQRDISDIIFVDYHKYDRAKSRETAEEISRFNSKLIDKKKNYILIGVGRWGSMDPWLGIPVKWDQISGAKAIIETSFKDFMVEPSQGSHFFQNLTSFSIGYFSVSSQKKDAFINWDWLYQQKETESLEYTKHLSFPEPMTVKINGRDNHGIILLPGLE